MIRRLSTWLLLSIGVHAGLAGAALIVLRVATPPILFIDLVHDLWGGETPVSSGRPGRREGGAAVESSAATAERAGGARVTRMRPPPPGKAPVGIPQAAAVPRETPTPDLLLSTPVELAQPVQESPRTPTPRAAEVERPVAVAPAASPAGAVEAERPSSLAVVPVETPPRGSAGGSAAAGGTGRGGVSSAVEREGPGGASGAGRGGTGDGPGLGRGLGVREGTALALAVPGDGGGDAAEYAAYLALLRRRVHEALSYPMVARRRSLTGTVQIELEIDPTGDIARVTLAASSSHRLLDEAALEAVRGLRRVPFPSNVRPRLLRVRLPVVFELR